MLARLSGRLLPFGWITALREKKNIDAVRVFARGVKPAYQHTGVAARFYQMHCDAAERTPQKGGERGWILETGFSRRAELPGVLDRQTGVPRATGACSAADADYSAADTAA